MKYIDSSSPAIDRQQWVPETRFGKWFLGTKAWYQFVLEEAFSNLHKLVGIRCPKGAKILDVGCGEGQSFSLIDKYFEPSLIKGVDIDPELLIKAKQVGDRVRCDVEVDCGSVQQMDIPDNTFDIVSCHQLIHHVTFREEALKELYRILKPGGLLLLGESCQPFLQIYWVRWLFRHPKMEQKTAVGYIDLVREAGFSFEEKDILETIPWWSRRDLGIFKKIGLELWRSETAEIFIVATKPE